MHTPKRFLKLLFLLIFLLALSLNLSIFAQDDNEEASTDNALLTLTHDGVERTYHLHLPAISNGTTPVPLVVALHQFASSGFAMEAETGLSDAADEYGYAVVYPNAIGNFFQDGRDIAGIGPDEGEKDDVGFLSELVDELTENYPIDPDQIYFTGSDNGALMSMRMICENPGRFAGFVSFGTSIWEYHTQICDELEAEPVNTLFIHGYEDSLYPIGGRSVPTNDERPDYLVLSVQDTVNWWALRNGCDPADVTVLEESLARILTAPCSENTTTALYLVNGGGHNWYREGDLIVNRVGVDATDILSRFIMGQDWVILPEAVTEPAEPRTWRTYVPTSYNPDEPMPLVVALHGRPGSGVGMALITGMSEIAEEYGFIAVYPDGMNDSMPANAGFEWNYVLGSPYFMQSTDRDDTQFLIDMMADISQGLNVDQRRLYLTGFSNGGFMTHRAACDAPTAFAAFAPVGSALFPGLETICDENNVGSVPILMMHGTEDVSIPWQGTSNTGPNGQPIYYTSPVQVQVGSWAIRNGCDVDNPVITPIESNGETNTQVSIVDFNDCDEGGETIFYMIEGGGHNWAGRPGIIGDAIAGQVNTDINASEVIWQFFSQYERDINGE
ncbi:MAG: PHB depolymerase family esterase [Aggregatilineales bacterium]